MTVTAIHKDPGALTMTLEAEFGSAHSCQTRSGEASTPARALVGPAHLPRHVHAPRSVGR